VVLDTPSPLIVGIPLFEFIFSTITTDAIQSKIVSLPPPCWMLLRCDVVNLEFVVENILYMDVMSGEVILGI